jgi:hypothetical protein
MTSSESARAAVGKESAVGKVQRSAYAGRPEKGVCWTSRKGAEGQGAREHSGTGEGNGKAREERSVGLDGSEVSEAEATKLKGQDDLGRNRASSFTMRWIREKTAARSWASTRAMGVERSFQGMA